MNTTCMPDLTEVLEGTGIVECDRDGVPIEDSEIVITREGFEHKVAAVTFTKINNLILGNEGEPGLISYLNGGELKLLLLISRFTVGYQDRRYWQASHETVAKMAGIGRKAVMMAADSLSSDDKKLISFSRTRGVTMWRAHPENIPAFLLKMSHFDSSQPEAERVKITQSMSQNDSMDESKGLNQRVKMTRPSKKESINKVERKKEKDSAPKNGAPQVAEISADLPEPPTAAHEVTPVEITDIQAVVQTAPPVAKSPPKPKAKAAVPLAVAKFHEVSQKYPNKALYSLIAETVGEKAEDIQFWGEVVLAYIGMGWNPVNITGMLEFYRKRVLPSKEPIRGGQNASNNQRHRRNAIPAQSLGGQSVRITAEQFFAAGATDLP